MDLEPELVLVPVSSNGSQFTAMIDSAVKYNYVSQK